MYDILIILLIIIILFLLYKTDTILLMIIKIIKKCIKKDATKTEIKEIIDDEPFSKIEFLIVMMMFTSKIILLFYIYGCMLVFWELSSITIGANIGLLYRVFFIDEKVTMAEFLTYMAIVTVIIAKLITFLLINFKYLLGVDGSITFYVILFFISFLSGSFRGIINIAKKSTFIITDDKLYYWFLIIMGIIGFAIIIFIYE